MSKKRALKTNRRQTLYTVAEFLGEFLTTKDKSEKRFIEHFLYRFHDDLRREITRANHMEDIIREQRDNFTRSRNCQKYFEQLRKKAANK